jgi:hypothetical protein
MRESPAAPVAIPNNHHRDRNAANDAAAEMGLANFEGRVRCAPFF